MYDWYMGVYVDVAWVYGGICGFMMDLWWYLWMFDGYIGMHDAYIWMYDCYMGVSVDVGLEYGGCGCMMGI